MLHKKNNLQPTGNDKFISSESLGLSWVACGLDTKELIQIATNPPNMHIRQAALIALLKIGDDQAANYLIRALRSHLQQDKDNNPKNFIDGYDDNLKSFLLGTGELQNDTSLKRYFLACHLYASANLTELKQKEALLRLLQLAATYDEDMLAIALIYLVSVFNDESVITALLSEPGNSAILQKLNFYLGGVVCNVDLQSRLNQYLANEVIDGLKNLAVPLDGKFELLHSIPGLISTLTPDAQGKEIINNIQALLLHVLDNENIVDENPEVIDILTKKTIIAKLIKQLQKWFPGTLFNKNVVEPHSGVRFLGYAILAVPSLLNSILVTEEEKYNITSKLKIWLSISAANDIVTAEMLKVLPSVLACNEIKKEEKDTIAKISLGFFNTDSCARPDDEEAFSDSLSMLVSALLTCDAIEDSTIHVLTDRLFEIFSSDYPSYLKKAEWRSFSMILTCQRVSGEKKNSLAEKILQQWHVERESFHHFNMLLWLVPDLLICKEVKYDVKQALSSALIESMDDESVKTDDIINTTNSIISSVLCGQRKWFGAQSILVPPLLEMVHNQGYHRFANVVGNLLACKAVKKEDKCILAAKLTKFIEQFNSGSSMIDNSTVLSLIASVLSCDAIPGATKNTLAAYVPELLDVYTSGQLPDVPVDEFIDGGTFSESMLAYQIMTRSLLMSNVIDAKVKNALTAKVSHYFSTAGLFRHEGLISAPDIFASSAVSDSNKMTLANHLVECLDADIANGQTVNAMLVAVLAAMACRAVDGEVKAMLMENTLPYLENQNTSTRKVAQTILLNYGRALDEQNITLLKQLEPTVEGSATRSSVLAILGKHIHMAEQRRLETTTKLGEWRAANPLQELTENKLLQSSFPLVTGSKPLRKQLT